MDGKTIGRRIRTLREARGLAKGELAELLKTTNRTIWNRERGNVPLAWTDLEVISSALRTPSDYIIHDTAMDRMQFSEEEISKMFEITEDLIKVFLAVTKSRYFFDFLSCILKGSTCEDFSSLDIERRKAKDCAVKLFDDAEYSMHEV